MEGPAAPVPSDLLQEPAAGLQSMLRRYHLSGRPDRSREDRPSRHQELRVDTIGSDAWESSQLREVGRRPPSGTY